ncbi:uncharacterized protein B0H18DRAFT_1080129 [Fomitopsis serialis]|uniref:uncharacterized protein n=1 Tax=Fomitopsis serialis TaxID=139415 RepID=UPI0020071FAC|nr:uncharacterized protein B0H18DRAFT_1080129 [Neoantrodia serialis]KAH9905544.1 hypothetical protein B0H18DRAFT_1080129 [Neoantrodia serialis]
MGRHVVSTVACTPPSLPESPSFSSASAHLRRVFSSDSLVARAFAGISHTELVNGVRGVGEGSPVSRRGLCGLETDDRARVVAPSLATSLRESTIWAVDHVARAADRHTEDDLWDAQSYIDLVCTPLADNDRLLIDRGGTLICTREDGAADARPRVQHGTGLASRRELWSPFITSIALGDIFHWGNMPVRREHQPKSRTLDNATYLRNCRNNLGHRCMSEEHASVIQGLRLQHDLQRGEMRVSRAHEDREHQERTT